MAATSAEMKVELSDLTMVESRVVEWDEQRADR